MLAIRSTAVRPAVSSRAAPRATFRSVVVMRASPNKIDAEMAEAMKAAENCETAGECAAAWDAVEEISAEMSHQKAKIAADPNQDPLEAFCAGNPDADECRVYED